MSLSAHSPSLAGGPPVGGANWGDSPYGSLISLGPKKLKKKPVLVLADEELAQAHLAMALGGAEIMEMQPDPVEAPRPRQPAMLLGLAPMGAEDDEDLSAYPAAAAVAAEPVEDGWNLPDPDEDEIEEEAEVQTWVPEDEPEDFDADQPEPGYESGNVADSDSAALPDLGRLLPPAASSDAAGQAAPGLFGGRMPSLGADDFDSDPPLPSIEEQMARMRERLAQRAARAAAQPAPAPTAAPVPAPEPKSTIERLELDDWGDRDSMKGFIPAQERDLKPAAPVPTPALRTEPRDLPPAPPPVAAPAPLTAPEPASMPEPQPATEPVFELEPEFVEQPEPVAALLDLAEPSEWDDEDDTPPPARVETRIAAGSANALRARMVDRTAAFEREPDETPSLLARLWSFLRGRGF